MRPILPLTFATVLLAATAPWVAARADDAAPQPRLEDATIEGHGGRLSITSLPVKTNHGTIYRDITIEFSADSAGNIIFARAGAAGVAGGGSSASAVIEQAPTPPTIEQHFLEGTYRAVADGALMRLSFRGKPINPFRDEPPMWELSVISGAAAVPDATWYQCPIAENPMRARLHEAGIASPAWNYGLSQAGDGRAFGSGALIGAAQDGNLLSIASFRVGCCGLSPTPIAKLVFERIGD